MKKRLLAKLGLVFFVCLIAFGTSAAEQPLSKDDVTLLLIGGATKEKMITLVERRGIDFQMDPDLAKKFRGYGAEDELINALQKASEKLASERASPPSSAPSGTAPNSVPSAPPAATSPTASPTSAPAPPVSEPTPAASPAASVAEKVQQVMEELGGKPAEAEDDSHYELAAPFSLTDIYGQRLSLADYKGQVVMLDFWASWCGPCRSQIPGFVELRNQYRDRGFAIIGIALDDRLGNVKEFYHRYRMNYPVAMGDRHVRSAYGGISGLPTTFLIGRDGRIRFKVTGAVNVEYLENRIQTLLATLPVGNTVRIEQASARPTEPQHPQAPAASTSPVLIAASNDPSQSPSASAVGATPAAVTPTPEIKPASSAPKSSAAPDLTDPVPNQIQRIIQEFATKEKLFKEARNNYTYHQINKVQTLDADGNPDGEYEQDWDILYDDNGKRIEHVTYAPVDTLQRIQVTQEDLNAMRSIQPFVLTSDELPEYEVKYLGHVRVDEITAYVFSIRPKEIQKGRQYFQGLVWVDDRDLQIVKSEGKSVPELKNKKGENLFPRFTTYREQIDGKFWFPTYTYADDKLFFAGGPVRIKEIIRYTDYKQFKAKVRIISVTPTDRPSAPTTPPPKP